jgi:catechol 2,3-dioxygenase-like lactoylglutathione lyase family enzyme
MPAVRLQHASVQVPVGELARATEFYREVLGLRHIRNLAGIAWFELPNGDHVHLVAGEGAPHSLAHLAVEVDDFDETLARVVAFGGTVEDAPNLWGSPRRFFRDPAGNLIEVFAWSPPLGLEGA